MFLHDEQLTNAQNPKSPSALESCTLSCMALFAISSVYIKYAFVLMKSSQKRFKLSMKKKEPHPA